VPMGTLQVEGGVLGQVLLTTLHHWLCTGMTLTSLLRRCYHPKTGRRGAPLPITPDWRPLAVCRAFQRLLLRRERRGGVAGEGEGKGGRGGRAAAATDRLWMPSTQVSATP
jgi:hypothetical protein